MDAVRDFIKKKVKLIVAECGTFGKHPMEVYKKAMEMGLHCLENSEEFGGAGLDYITVAAVFEDVRIPAGNRLGKRVGT